jgi:hypothetical protein
MHLFVYFETNCMHDMILKASYRSTGFLGTSLQPSGSALPRNAPPIVFYEAEQSFSLLSFLNYYFSFNSLNQNRYISLPLGASPQTPRVGFAEFRAANCLLRSRTTLFASFSR